MLRISRFLVSFIVAAIFVALPSLAAAQPADGLTLDQEKLAACLDACAQHMESCTTDAAVVDANCSLLDACKDVKLNEKLAKAIAAVCEASCNTEEKCGTTGVLPPFKGRAPKPAPPPAGPKPTWTAPKPGVTVSKEEADCRAKNGAWVEVVDPTGIRYECMTVGRLYVRLIALEERMNSLKGSGDPEALANLQKEVDALKQAGNVSPDFAKANESRLKALEDMLEIEQQGDAIRSRRLDQHAEALKNHASQIEDLKVEEGHSVIGFDAGGYAFVGTTAPYGRARAGAGAMLRFRGRLNGDWDLGVGGNLCYSGEDLDGAPLKCVGGEISAMYRVEEWIAIRFGVDTLWRLNPKNNAESSSSGPLFGVDLTPGADDWRFLGEVNIGVKATVVPEVVENDMALHTIPDVVFNTALGVRFN